MLVCELGKLNYIKAGSSQVRNKGHGAKHTDHVQPSCFRSASQRPKETLESFNCQGTGPATADVYISDSNALSISSSIN
jgi:hypothetical protein